LQINRDSVVATVIMDTISLHRIYSQYFVDLNPEETDNNWITPPHPLKSSGSISSVDSILSGEQYEFRTGRELIWWGNMEDEGCTLWNLNSSKESYCDTVSFAGERCIQHIRTENNSSNIITNFEERIICPSDEKKYSLCAYIKTNNGENVTIQVRYYESRSSYISLDTENMGAQISGDTPWTFYHKELSIPEGTNYFDIRLYSGIPSSDTAFSWFDDVSLICWEDWSEYNISQNIPTPNDYYFLQIKSPDNADEIIVYYTETGYEPEHYDEVDLKLFLEGPFNGVSMNTILSDSSILPLNQPYNAASWNYPGTESVTNIPNPEIVDWVLVEFRDAPDAISATEATIVKKQAAFLKSDGSIVGIDGMSMLTFNHSLEHSLFVVIRHRNHVDIISAYPLTAASGVYSYDFTSSINQVLGGSAGFKAIWSGIYGMAAGDMESNGSINSSDLFQWSLQGGEKGYLQEDLNFDGEANNTDKDDLWLFNVNNYNSQLPQ